MADKIATRAAYGAALVEFAGQYPELVVLDADLSGSTMTKDFAKAHPDRFFDMGIAEANMVGVAAGLAACGKKPFVNSFAMFSSGRAWEQVRNSVAYPGLNVKVIGSHGGLSVGEDGATHQCIEDYAIMRAIPGMTVLSPCDGPEMELAVKALLFLVMGYREGRSWLSMLGVTLATQIPMNLILNHWLWVNETNWNSIIFVGLMFMCWLAIVFAETMLLALLVQEHDRNRTGIFVGIGTPLSIATLVSALIWLPV